MRSHIWMPVMLLVLVSLLVVVGCGSGGGY
jgi:hypothetical protein